MIDDSGAEDNGQPSRGEGGPRVTRRAFLGATVAGGAAVVAGSLGYWGMMVNAASKPSASPRPTATKLPGATPTAPPPTRRFRSRPDLSSPLISISTPGLHASADPIFLTPKSGPGPVIVDNDGAPVWIHPTPSKAAFNLRMATYRGAPVLTWFEGKLVLGTGQGEYVLADESYTEVARVRAGNGLQGDLHEFILTAAGTALFTAYQARDIPGATPAAPTPGASPRVPQVFDSVVQEVDVASGTVLFEWHAFDHVGLDESYATVPADHAFDYFHINSIDVDTDGNLLISARSTCALYKIDRHSGDVIWRLGGKKSDFSIGPGANFAWQHDARRQPDGTITLFDDGTNGANAPTEVRSRGLVLDVDESARTVTLRTAYSHAGTLLAKSQGSMQPLPNGNVFVGWGDQPLFTEFTPDGATVFDARLPDASTSYRALRFPWHGLPAELPALATEPGDGASTNVYASWNGATDVAIWVALGGDSADALAPVGSQPRSGFETLITIQGRPRLIAVRALDSSGAVIGESAPLSS